MNNPLTNIQIAVLSLPSRLQLHGRPVTCKMAISNGSLALALQVLVILKLQGKPGGLSKMDGLDIEVTMTDALFVGLCAGSVITLPFEGK